MINLKEIPKVELHLHLDGSLRIKTVSELLNIKEEEIISKMVAPDKCLDLNEYLTKFDVPISVMQTKENLIRISYELGEDLIEDGIIYAEIRFAPINHIKEGLTLDNVVESVLDGLNRVNLKTNLILCLMRHSSFEDNLKIIKLAKKYLNKGVCAIDLAGAESLYETKNFEELFKLASDYNIPFTIHAGEADGIESIKSAINFGAKRIGHGIRIIEDISVLETLKQKRIPLEICPTSNIQTNVVEDYNNHPIKYLFNNDIVITINTDNRTVSNISLTDEYIKLIKQFDFSLLDIKKMNIDAINNSFINNSEKEKLLEELEIKYKELI